LLPTGLNVLDVSHWPHGVYSIRISAGELTAAKKMIIH